MQWEMSLLNGNTSKNPGAIFPLVCGAMYFSSLCLFEWKEICGDNILSPAAPWLLTTTVDAGGSVLHPFFFMTNVQQWCLHAISPARRSVQHGGVMLLRRTARIGKMCLVPNIGKRKKETKMVLLALLLRFRLSLLGEREMFDGRAKRVMIHCLVWFGKLNPSTKGYHIYLALTGLNFSYFLSFVWECFSWFIQSRGR